MARKIDFDKEMGRFFKMVQENPLKLICSHIVVFILGGVLF